MTESSKSRGKLAAYVGSITIVLAVILAYSIERGIDLQTNMRWWLLFTTLYAATEFAVLFFHHESARVGLSAAEAIFIPMMVALSFEQTVLGVTVGAIVVSVAHLRMGKMKALFNVAQFGCSAAAGA